MAIYQIHHTTLRSPLAQPHIEAIWVAAAAAIGWRVERGAAAYATADGNGGLLIGFDELLDPQDAAAQLIFHELCHGLVEGPDRWNAPDWGLENADDRDVVREHACLRVQVHFSERHGLRELMAPTTEYRAYHDQIAGEPLVNADDPAAAVARAAIERSISRVWNEVLQHALADTRRALDAVATAPAAQDDAAALHPVGFAFARNGESCGTCAWRYRGGRGRPVERCRQAAGADGNGRRTEARFHACVLWERPVDCLSCGACCREAYHSVTVSVRDPVVWKRPELVLRHGHRFELLRAGERCAALMEEGATGVSAAAETPAPPAPALQPSSSALKPPRAFSCAIYEDRPRTCRDFEAGGRHCLVARRRVGLSA